MLLLLFFSRGICNGMMVLRAEGRNSWCEMSSLESGPSGNIWEHMWRGQEGGLCGLCGNCQLQWLGNGVRTRVQKEGLWILAALEHWRGRNRGGATLVWIEAISKASANLTGQKEQGPELRSPGAD